MMRQQDQQLIERFRDRVRGGATRGLRATLRVAGGRPSERLDHRLVLEGDGAASLDVSDARDPSRSFTRRENLDPVEAAELWAEIERRVDRFASRGRAAFVPDSLVGYATLEVDGDVVELVFAPDVELLPPAHSAQSTPLGDLARRTILAAQRPPEAKED
jgi:hypothetical protein